MRRSLRIEMFAGLVLVACVCACAASNPSRTGEPAPWEPKPKSEATIAAPKTTSTADAPANANAAISKEEGGTAPAQDVDKKTNAADKPAEKPADKPAPTAAKTAPAAGDAAAASSTSSADSLHTPLPGEESIIARVAGEPVYVSELLSQQLYTDTVALNDQFDHLLQARIIVEEASRLRLRVDPKEDTAAYETAVKMREEQLDKKRKGTTLDSYVDRALGLDPIRYREMLRSQTRQSLLGDRVIRAWLLQQEHTEFHFIVVDNADAVKDVQKDLADGVKFEDVARNRSIDPSKDQGGQGPVLPRADTLIGKLLSSTAAGAVGGPIEDHGSFVFVRVDAQSPALDGDWSSIGPAVEASVKKYPITSAEAARWYDAMMRRYKVDTKPWFQLLHEPIR